MYHVEIYSGPEEKKTNPSPSSGLSPQESLIRILDLMDFYAALSGPNKQPSQNSSYIGEIEWIELRFRE